MIYLMREQESGHYKVGMSMSRRHAQRRIGPIAADRRKRKGRRSTVKLLLWADWPHTAEMEMHRYLWECWIEGEWFADSERLQQCVKWMQTGSGYIPFKRAFVDCRASLPGPWGLLNRDIVLRNHIEKHVGVT